MAVNKGAMRGVGLAIVAAPAILGVWSIGASWGEDKQPPPRVFDLGRLRQFRAALSPADAARLHLSFLQEEIADPTQRTRGAGNGFITHEYVLAQIVLAAAQTPRGPSRALLRDAADGAGDGVYRDCIGLTLGLGGDRTVVPFLVEYAADMTHPPDLRERAVRALGKCPDERAIPALAAALDDPFYVYSQDYKAYVIRITARASLLRLKAAGLKLPAEVERALSRVVAGEKLPPDAVIP